MLIGGALAGAFAFSSSASAYTLNADGTGFVGKGEVQQALNLNNAQLQNGKFEFAAVSTVVTEVTWECTNSNNENVRERARTTTTETERVLSSTARLRNRSQASTSTVSREPRPTPQRPTVRS